MFHKPGNLAVIFSLFIFTGLQAQSVDEIVAKHLKALGGKETIAAIKSIRINGKSTITAMGFEAGFKRTAKRPNLVRLDISMQGQQMVQAYDGKTAWQIMPFMGNPDPQPMPELQAKQMIREADFDGPIVNYKKKGNKIELVGKEDLEGSEVYKLKVTLKDGDTFYSYIDAEYFLELKRVMKTKGPGGNEIEVTTYMSDYKPVDGMMMPHSIRIQNPVQGAIEVTFTTVETNIDVDDSYFQMPKKSGN